MRTAQGRRIRVDRRRKILVPQLAVEQADTAGIALEEPTVVKVEAGESLAAEDQLAVVGQPRDQTCAGRIVKALAGLAVPKPEAQPELAYITCQGLAALEARI